MKKISIQAAVRTHTGLDFFYRMPYRQLLETFEDIVEALKK